MGERPSIAAIILAGGKGTRLFPLTLKHSKPAVFFGGKYRLIDIPISNSINADINQIFVIAQYLSSELYHHLNQTYRFDLFSGGNIEFLTPSEDANSQRVWFEGTADSVRKNLSSLLESPFDYFLILSGDQLYNMDFKKMFQFALDKNADLTIATLPVEEKTAHRLGIMKVDKHLNIVDFVEKPKEKEILQKFSIPNHDFRKKWCLKCSEEKKYLGSMGIYIFKRNALEKLLKEDPREDFGKHLIPTKIKQGKSFAYIYDGYWEDIGTISSYYEANMAMTKSNLGLNIYDEKNPIYFHQNFLPGPLIHSTKVFHSFICNGSKIEAKEVSNSVIGSRIHIKKGSIVKDSILFSNYSYLLHQSSLPTYFSIGENCIIEKTIIDEHVQIGNNVKLTNKKNLQTYDGNGIFIRDGIIIVTANTKLPDNFTL